MHDDFRDTDSSWKTQDKTADLRARALEEELLDAIRKGYTLDSLFPVLLDVFQERVYRHVARMLGSREDAMDVTQEVFVKIWSNLSSFEGRSRLFTWIYRIATNEALGWIRKHRKMQGISLDDERAGLAHQMSSSEGVDAALAQEYLDKALSELPPKQRQVFLLRYQDEMPYKEMSAVLETSVGALKASYHHAVRKVEASIRQVAANSPDEMTA